MRNLDVLRIILRPVHMGEGNPFTLMVRPDLEPNSTHITAAESIASSANEGSVGLQRRIARLVRQFWNVNVFFLLGQWFARRLPDLVFQSVDALVRIVRVDFVAVVVVPTIR